MRAWRRDRGTAVPTVLKFILMIVLAGVVFGFFSMTFFEVMEGRNRSDLRRDAEDLAGLIESFKTQAPGAYEGYDIDVPEDSVISFEGENVVCVSGKAVSYKTGIDIDGPILNPGNYHLEVTRNEENVEVRTG